MGLPEETQLAKKVRTAGILAAQTDAYHFGAMYLLYAAPIKLNVGQSKDTTEGTKLENSWAAFEAVQRLVQCFLVHEFMKYLVEQLFALDAVAETMENIKQRENNLHKGLRAAYMEWRNFMLQNCERSILETWDLRQELRLTELGFPSRSLTKTNNRPNCQNKSIFGKARCSIKHH